MSFSKTAIAFLGSLLTSLSGIEIASAAPQPTTESKPPAAVEKSGSKLQKEMSFEELLVQGKFHFSDEAVTTVEEDKVLDSLIGVRKDFKDRVRQSAVQK